LSALGWATPDFVVGRVTMNGGGGFWTFFPWFSRNAYFLHGNAANATFPEPTTLVLLMFAAAGGCFRRSRAA
jgi:hypothetical protein